MKASTNTFKVTVTRVNNPFNRFDKEIFEVDELGWSSIHRELVLKYADECYIAVNGNLIPIDSVLPLNDGDRITIIPRVAGSGDGKQIFGLVAMFALAFIGAPYLAGFVGVQGTLAYAIAYTAVMVGGALLIGSLMPGPKLDKGVDVQPSYGWNPHNTQSQGIPIPRYYGKNKIFGNYIAVHTEPSSTNNTKELINAIMSLCSGPVKSIDSIQIHDQPVEAYDDVLIETRLGHINQTPISFFEETKAQFIINRLVTHSDGAVEYLLPDADFDVIEVGLTFDRGLFFANDKGGLSAHTVGIKIEIKEDDPESSYSTLVARNLTAAKTSPVHINYRSDGSYPGGNPVDVERGKKYKIRVTKTSDDRTSSRFGDRLKLQLVREVLNDGFSYPRTAMIGVKALATDQLSGSLVIDTIVEGAIINVFDGTNWSLEYSNNPAWVLWDIFTQPVISGDGGEESPYQIEEYEGIDPSRLDLPKFYELATFSDELVSDGDGGNEKRLTFNGGFEEHTTMWEAALTVCEVARCIPVWNGIKLSLAINKPGTVVQAFSDGNIIKGSFKETFLPVDDRLSEIEISYVDSELNFERTVFSIFDENSPFFYNKATVNMQGIDKSSRAWRAGMLRLLQNRYLYSTIEFQADIDAIACTIGDIIYVQSSVPKWGEGGRVVSATDDTVVLDRVLNLDAGTKKVMVKTFDPVNEQEQIDVRTVSSVVGKTITVTENWTVNPSKGDVYAMGLENLIGKKYRVIGLQHHSEQKFTITALNYDEAIYGGDTSEPVIPTKDYTSPGSNGTNIFRPRTPEEIENKYPIDNIFLESAGITADIPLFNGFSWTNDAPSAGSISWLEFTLYYKGETYTVVAGNSNFKYVYWDLSNPTAISGTNSLISTLGANRWVVGVNDDGTFFPTFGSRIIHGGLIEADTIDANHINVTNLAAIQSTYETSLGGDTRLRINANGIQISNNAGSTWSDFLWNDSGVVKVNADLINAGSLNATMLTTGLLHADRLSSGIITTIKLALNSVTTQSSSTTAGSTSLDTDWKSVQTASFTSVSGMVNLNVLFTVEFGSITHGVYYELRRSSTVLISGFTGNYANQTVAFSAAAADFDPGTGSITYTLYLKTSTSTGAASNRTIQLVQFKR